MLSWPLPQLALREPWMGVSVGMAVREEMEKRLREELRALYETKHWLIYSGVAAERPEALLEIEREIGRLHLLLEELEHSGG